MPTEAATHVILAVSNNTGYCAKGATDHTSTMTLRDLIDALEAAADEHGDDALVVTHDSGNRYGANFGCIDIYADTITLPEDEDEDSDDEDDE